MDFTAHAMDLGWPIQLSQTEHEQVFPGACLNRRLKKCGPGEKVHHLVLDVSGLTCPHPNIGPPIREDGVRVFAYSYIQFPI